MTECKGASDCSPNKFICDGGLCTGKEFIQASLCLIFQPNPQAHELACVSFKQKKSRQEVKDFGPDLTASDFMPLIIFVRAFLNVDFN